MYTAAVSTASQASLYSQVQQYFQTRQNDLQQLGKDLNTGDTSDAAAEYQDIVQLGQSGPFASGNAFSRTDRQGDFAAIGTALQSGDLAGAQQAFSNLKATFQPAVTVQDPVAQPQNPVATPILSTAPPSTATGSDSEIVLNLAAPAAGSGPEQINITIGNSSSGGEQLSIGIGSQGSTAQQVTTLNLPANSDEEIVLNLLAPAAAPAASTSTTAASTTAASTTTASTGSNLSVTA